MKKIYILLIAIFTINIANAQWQQTSLGGNYSVGGLAISGNNIFAGTDSGVYVSSDYGSTWVAQNTGLTNLQVVGLAISGSTIAANTNIGGVFLSTNNGSSWSLTYSQYKVYGLAIINNILFLGTEYYTIMIPLDGSNSYIGNDGIDDHAFTISGSNILSGSYSPDASDGCIFLSTDNGLDWNVAKTGLTAGDNVTAFATSGNNVFAGTDAGSIFFSPNNGSSWSTVNTSQVAGALIISGINLFAGAYDAGVYLSTNNGSSWSAVNTGLTNLKIMSLAICGNYIFAGTDGGGVWIRSLPDILGIEENKINNEISFYPNPAINQTTITYPQINIEGVLQVYNILGQLIYKENILKGSSQLILNIQNYKAGLYKVILRENGMIKGQVSLVKQ